MDKFEKRLRKVSKNTENALVIGTAFGSLEKILSIYRTVFVISEDCPTIKAKNLVYRENFDHLNLLSEINVIFFDLNTVAKLEIIKDFWQRHNSKIVIQGNDPIGREFSKPLYETGWGCTSLQGMFHIWEKMK
jgi:hypothetical protein